MIGISSPFIEQIPKCKTSMRKLRKKIYKYTIAQPRPKKIKDYTQQIFNILQMRLVPDFLIDSLKKKRTLDLSALKNVVINMGSSLNEMSSLVRNQQKQVQEIFKDHKQRIKTLRRISPKLDHRVTTFSSTQQSKKSDYESPYLSNECSVVDSGSQGIHMENSLEYIALSSSLLSQEALFSF